MSDTASVYTQTPLHYFREEFATIQAPGIEITESPLLGHLVIRGDGRRKGFCTTVETALSLPLPKTPCTWHGNDDCNLYWLGPTEWLAIVPSSNLETVGQALREKLKPHCSVVDVSGGQTLLTLSGPQVTTVLKKSSSYDFDPRYFTPGRCVQTAFAKASALVARRDDNSIELVVRRSFADYLAKWLLNIAPRTK